MNLRKATETDIAAIIDLLKISLGESLIPKSEDLWNWKHVYNPFGKSPVLIAEENEEIIGVRAFLRWNYAQNGKIIRTCRAVDTATHPKYQGKGIFSKLTLALLEELQQEGVQAVFNTPNTQSTPGYLKMGWEKWGNLPLKLKFHLGKTKSKQGPLSDWHAVEGLITSLEAENQSDSKLITHLSPGYLNWRYRDSPLFPYHYLSDGNSYLLIYRIKEGKMGREFRICDFFTTAAFSKLQEKAFKKALNGQIQASGARFSSFSGLSYPSQNSLDMGFLPILKIGPLVTLRKIQEDFIPLNQPWHWSLGDLEVF
jgi:N-acetylglutamate synthase-like GNAT family acetyltransferase